MNFIKIFLIPFISFSISAQKHSIIISEIFADPTPSKGLPEKEFIELFNNSNQIINLEKYQLKYGNFSATFPNFNFEPNTYLIVCRRGNESELFNFGTTISLSNFSLPNNGSLLVLLDNNQNIIHSVDYKLDWYSQGKDQGFSLEMIDLNYPCVGKGNWASSQNPLGGTPGKVNSINAPNPDLNGPVLLEYNLQQNSLELVFNERLDENFDLRYVELDGFDLGIKSFNISEENFNSLAFDFENELPLNQQVKLNILKLVDCSGNISENISLELYNLPLASKGDIVLSEILFDPPAGGSDFLEIFNISNKNVNLKNWKIARKNSRGEVSDIETITTSDFILKSKTYLALSEDIDFLRFHYKSSTEQHLLKVLKLPSFILNESTVYLLNPEGEIYDFFDYNEKMHHPSLVNTKGVSLEKINFDGLVNEWQSASAEVNFATPGLPNSQATSELLQNEIFVEPIVFNPYQPNENPIANLIFNLNTTANTVSVNVFDANGLLKRRLRNNSLMGSFEKIAWDGKDQSGQLLPVGYYFFNINLVGNQGAISLRRKVVLGSY
jgi:hypothetical protein